MIFDTEFWGLEERNFRIWMHTFRLRGSLLLVVYECFVQPTIYYYRSTTPYSHYLSANLSSPRWIRFQLLLTRLVCMRRKYERSLPGTTMDPPETLMVLGQIIISSNLLQGDDSRDGSFKVDETLEGYSQFPPKFSGSPNPCSLCLGGYDRPIHHREPKTGRK